MTTPNTMHFLRRTRRASRVMGVGLALLLAACVGDKGVAPSTRSPSGTLGTVIVTPLNAIMAVGDTVRLTVAGQSILDQPMSDFDSVTFSLGSLVDTLRVHLAPDGLVTALSPSGAGSPVQINVVAFRAGVAKADQALIQITSTAIAGLTLSIHPVPPDSTKLAQGAFKQVTPIVWNPVTNESVDGPVLRLEQTVGEAKLVCQLPYVQVVDYTIEQLGGNVCRGGANYIQASSSLGMTWVKAQVLAYGTLLRDSVQYTLTYPYLSFIVVGSSGTLTIMPTRRLNAVIAPGGTVIFASYIPQATGATMNFTFSDSTVALSSGDGTGAGNIYGLEGSGGQANRIFQQTGTYTWTATVIGGIAPFTGQSISGKIIVQ